MSLMVTEIRIKNRKEDKLQFLRMIYGIFLQFLRLQISLFMAQKTKLKMT